ncbi:glycosyltransferase family 4 protein, partial [Patescibacteria group bacterium]|nr:glycosyltransferase family 4 protein [Patescibacteria group bacterium]
MPNNKVCHITTVHSPFDVRIFHKECKTLANAGYDVILIAQHDKDEVVVDGVQIIALPKTKSRIHRMITLPLKAFHLALKQNANIYHFHDPELLPVGLALKLITKSKVIYDVHEDCEKDMLSKPYLPERARRFVAIAIKIAEWVISRIFDGIVPATDDISSNFSNHQRVVVVKNFPVLSDFTEIKRNIRNAGDIFNLIYVGCLTEIRGITQMIQSLEFINSQKRVKLTLFGKFYPLNYEEQIKSLKGFEKAEHLGWIRPQEIPEEITQSDVGIVCFLPEPNHINAMPTKLFEYMACGIPVIVSNFPLWKEIVEGNNCGVCVDPLNHKEIA